MGCPQEGNRGRRHQGCALEDEDEATDEEDLDRAGEVASSSSSDLPNLPAVSSTSAPSANPSA